MNNAPPLIASGRGCVIGALSIEHNAFDYWILQMFSCGFQFSWFISSAKWAAQTVTPGCYGLLFTLIAVHDANYITEVERRSFSTLPDRMPLRHSRMLDTATRPARSSRASRSAH